MASKRALQVLPRCTRQAFPSQAQTIAIRWSSQSTRSNPVPRIAAVRRDIARAQGEVSQQRWHSSFPSGHKSKPYQFEDVLSIVEDPTSTTLLIDAREPAEYAANSIPMALNIPVTSQPDALLLSAEEFEDRFGWQKPPLSHEVVFFCKAGVRSSAAAQLAKQAGYEKVGEYRGSWLDWEKRGGPKSKDAPAPGGKGEPVEFEVKERDPELQTASDRTLRQP